MKNLNKYIIEKLKLKKDAEFNNSNKEDIYKKVDSILSTNLHYIKLHDYNYIHVNNNYIEIDFKFAMDKFSFTKMCKYIESNLKLNIKNTKIDLDYTYINMYDKTIKIQFE